MLDVLFWNLGLHPWASEDSKIKSQRKKRFGKVDVLNTLGVLSNVEAQPK